jgi:hypothetical protein
MNRLWREKGKDEWNNVWSLKAFLTLHETAEFKLKWDFLGQCSQISTIVGECLRKPRVGSGDDTCGRQRLPARTGLLVRPQSPKTLGPEWLGRLHGKGHGGRDRGGIFLSAHSFSDSLVPGGDSHGRALERQGAEDGRGWVRPGAWGAAGWVGVGGAAVQAGRGARVRACRGAGEARGRLRRKWAVAAAGSARSGASRSALGPRGPQPRPVCRGRTRGLCDPRRGALRPPRPVPADARSVGRSVSRRARAAGAAGALSVRERSVAPGEAAAAATGGASSCCLAQGSGRAEGLPRWVLRHLALEVRERRGLGAREALPSPFARRPAWPSERVRTAAARGAVLAGQALSVGLSPARRPAVGRGSAGPGLHPAPLGAAPCRQWDLGPPGEVRQGWYSALGRRWPGTAGGKGLAPGSRRNRWLGAGLF